ncbi:MAG: sodium:proton antiporter [Firmicutes bacterium HGW-Firmicutes-10]|jgi:Na+/H+ antiporter NhaC|nr:MAG: sodium:proton antiporter [Firmicutes bacterium HGW-Firmicutes-10]
MDTYGIVSLIPVTVVIVVAVITRRSFEPLLLGGIIGYLIIDPGNFLINWINSLTTIAGDLGWYYVLFVVIGIFILLLEKSGGALGFADLSAKFAKTRSTSLIITWLLGIAIFLDDYLNCLGVSVAMRKITDKFKVPREFLAYVVNSTGATVCLLVPVSTWAVYMASQFELVGVTKNGTGLGAYIASIPYMFYAWAAVIIVPLFALKILPTYGPMKKAIERAETTGEVFPPGYHETHQDELVGEEIKKTGALNFVIPILALTVVALVKNDVMLGIFAGLIACAIIYIPRKILKPLDFLNSVPEGLQSMAVVMITMTGSFVLNAVNQEMGLTPYVLDTVTPLISGPLFPLITFLVLSGLSFATASPWAMATVSFPIIMPLAQAVGADPFMIGGALIAGTAFGSHACFYGDAAILTCAACNVQPFEYARTSIPLILAPTAIGAIAYLILGFVLM